MKKKIWNALRWLPLLPLAFAVFVFGFVIPGCRFAALVCAGVMGLITFYNLADILKNRFPKTVRYSRRAVTAFLLVFLLIAGATEGFILEASLGDPEETCEYILILGAKVRYDGPSVSLMDRIRGAYDYMTAHPEVIAIASGGQGADEPMSEGQCIREHLIRMGIDEDRIWVEDRSASTWANLNYSLEIIQEKTGERPEKLGIVSSEYHLLRAGMMARDCGVEAVGIPAKTSLFSQRFNHFLREIAGVWFYLIVGGHYD